MPLLTQIADFGWFAVDEQPSHLLPDILIRRAFHEDRIVFGVVDYRTNHSTCFSASVGVINVKDEVEVFLFLPTVEVNF